MNINTTNTVCTFLNELPQQVIEIAQRNYARMLEDSGKYTELEVAVLVRELPNKEITDLENELDAGVYNYLYGLQNGTINIPYYIKYDIQDKDDFEVMNFEEVRNWLHDFWESNPNEDDEEEEQSAWLEKIISVTCPSKLFNMLGGIGYAMEEIETTLCTVEAL